MSGIEEFSSLFARLGDLCEAALGGSVGISDFLSPKEIHHAAAYLHKEGVNCFFFGGYDGAERKKAYILPEYMEGISDVSGLAEYGFDCDIGAVIVKTDGYRRLSHRDYLGSLLGLGVERAVIGDVLVLGGEGHSAVVLCTPDMKNFFISELDRVSREKVRVSGLELSDVPLPERRFQPISDTVASARLDCIVSSLCNLSREKSREVVVSGLVELDYEREERPDRAISTPCTVSVRGYGKFKVHSVNEQTKKGRLRLSAEKYL